MNNTKELHLLEDLFDAQNLSPSEPTPFVAAKQILLLCHLERWTEILASRSSLLREAAPGPERALVAHCVLAASDAKGDSVIRAELTSNWNCVVEGEGDLYCLFLRSLNEGLSRFYLAHLREAESLFELALRLADELGFTRGRMIALFHLGLVDRDRENPLKAAAFFTQAAELAQARAAISYLHRIEAQLHSLNRAPKAATGTALVEELITLGNFSQARTVLLDLEKLRRRRGLGRNAESLFIYLGLIYCGLGRVGRGQKIISRTADPALKLRALLLKSRTIGIDGAEQREIAFLRSALGISGVHGVSGREIQAPEIAGRRFENVSDESVRRLVRAMLDKNTLSKEEIVQSVWGLSYDPVVHDKKVYNLIQKSKQAFGRRDLFVNTYGAYSLNPDLLGASLFARNTA